MSPAAWLRSLGLLALLAMGLPAQEVEVERPGPPTKEDFETDTDGDGVPDGWYNFRDVRMAEGGIVGKTCLRFENARPGRAARASRAFGLDGSKTEAIIIGAWVRGEKIQSGERLGEDAGLVIDFLGDELRTLSRGMMGPWTNEISAHWVHVARRIPVPPGAKEAIMSIGLLGATGTLEVDGLTFDLVPRGGAPTTNLLLNGDFELGDPAPIFWFLDDGARKVSPGYRSPSALDLPRAKAKALCALGRWVNRFETLDVRITVRASHLRNPGAGAQVFFLDADGRELNPPGAQPPFLWSGSFDWRVDRVVLPVPAGAVEAVIQVEKFDGFGSIRIDDVVITEAPTPRSWTPYHVADDTQDWLPFAPSPEIEAKSALDASALVEAPAGQHGFVTVRDGHLQFEKGGRARFFGVVLLPPMAFVERERADALADRLARSGVNLVRFDDLDAPFGPGRSLFDDNRDDTQAFDPLALAKFDHLVAALKARGIYIALDFLSARRFREGDGVAGGLGLPPGGGPAAAYDPKIRALTFQSAERLLSHVNPETGLALRDDPVLAWVSLVGEKSLFDGQEGLPPESLAILRGLAAKSSLGAGRRFWQATESAQWKALAEDLRQQAKLRVPIAANSHWRREPPEFLATLAAPGIDLIEDRLYWHPPQGGLPDRRSMVGDAKTGIGALATRKRKADRPYVVGEWADQTHGGWAYPHEAADLMLGAAWAASEDWDALVRRGVFLHPEVWGAAATGTGGGEDIFGLAEVLNGTPQVFSLLPHAASVALRGHGSEPAGNPRTKGPLARGGGPPGWDPKAGRLVIETPYTQGIAGWPGGRSVRFESLTFEVESPFAVVVASSLGAEPIAKSRRLLISAIARVEPTGFAWADEWKRDVAAPGLPPLLQEPVQAAVLWKQRGHVRAYALDNTGKRTGPARLDQTAEGYRLVIDGRSPTVHWELTLD
ncbi:MAG: hypothetical protein IRY99_15195 [Isosphaeraceae bacterium]|nr:hypothetical protein [Isosphaeraceae bacterium]